jgi:hypothetical protein
VILAQPHQALELLEARVGAIQPAQPVPIGAQIVGQLVAVASVGLGPGGTPARTRRPERGRVHRHHRVPSGHQAVDNQPAGALDDDRQRGRLAKPSQAVQRRSKILLGVPQRPAVNHRAGVIQHGHVMGGARPVPADEHLASLWSVAWLHRLIEALVAGSSLLGPRRGGSLTPVCRASVRQGRQN